ncbi:MAG: O-antigen polymerase family protein [Parcubacteria group bacterium GW2011_GWC1_43_61]|nr:MAG: O-antigen polymerase family protein [Candidatus Azambacteria bacterium GW2011_GWF2_42_22]KKT03145.1 MAG: O-antigen polymerase family protein [Candidatus Azambacteria bacterium GW2011_GWD1_43_18]KKT16208.1 MAG: O-antigen polymerase family protein [Parcubacteria group bacterium GW2011_GWC1_43_61]OGD41185.1 MAG: hypothetical protein A3K28_01360 [Candidatus Azambacteria bacterium RIFOXYB1_FULL_40_33]OGD41683.1 MAG: hypothetical protein A3I82_00995 [Candidatus Azambacteria bacterium RIFCSPLO
MFRIELYLPKIIKYGLYAILLTPLAFWPKALYPFLTPKFILFQILIEIIFGAWLILAISNKEYRPKFSWLLAAITAFSGISLISALFGVDFDRSVWGIGPRMTGLFAEFHFLVWFLVLVSISKSGFDFKKYLNFSFFVSLAVALTAFYQNSQWGLALGYGVFSNATFAAPYFIFHFFWGIYQFSVFSFSRLAGSRTAGQFSVLKKWLFGIGGAFLFISIILTQIRGAILGLLIGIFIFGLILIFTDILGRRFRILVSVCYLLFFMGLSGIWYWRDSRFIQNFGPIKKITGASLSETTVQTRLLAWRTAWEGFRDRPLLGAGPENFNYLFNARYNPKFLGFGNGGFDETWFDKPHNAFLEILTETGITGSLLYILVWLTVALALFKLFRSGQKFLSLTLFSAFIAYFGAVFFSFDSFGSWFGLYLFLACLILHDNLLIPRIEESVPPRRDGGKILGINRKLAPFVIGIVALVIFLIYINYSIWRANMADADALRIFPVNTAQSIDSFKRSLNYFTPYGSEYRFDLASSVIGATQKNLPIQDLENTLNFTLSEADKALAAHPKNAAYYTDMAKLYNILGEKSGDLSFLTQAEEYGKKSLELSPDRQETLFYLAQSALLKGDIELSLEWTKQAVTANSAIGQSHWYLGRLYIIKGQKTEGIAEIERALALGYKPLNQGEKNIIKNLGIEINSQ